MLKIAIAGSQGRMGQRITALADEDADLQIAALLERGGHPDVGKPVCGVKVSEALDDIAAAEVLIDFTTPQATLQNVDFCQQHHVAMVIGTTGLTEKECARIADAAKRIPIVFSANMSIGVNILFKLAEVLAAAAPGNYEVRMREAHHVHKKDAPSGTAKTLAKIIEDHSQHRVEDIEAVREGEIIGDHRITFESAVDTICIEHHAKTRDIFVKGALLAAKYLQGKTAGLFSMQEVLSLTS